MALTRIVQIITLIEFAKELLLGETGFEKQLEGKLVLATNHAVRWHYAGLSPYDEKTLVGTDHFGVATGKVWRSNRNIGSGLLYIEVQLSRNIGTYLGRTYDDELIWVVANDVSTYGTASGSQGTGLVIIGLFALMWMLGQK